MRTIDNDILLGEICTQLSQGKKVKLRAKGNSMHPFIHGNEDTLVLIHKGKLHKGDVVLARIDGNRYVIHRIIHIDFESFTLMGDNNLYATEECSQSDIFGTVETIIRNGKERSLNSSYVVKMAMIWRVLLPIRRLKHKIFHKFCVPTTPAHPA